MEAILDTRNIIYKYNYQECYVMIISNTNLLTILYIHFIDNV